jgi:hypothetical protein
MKHEKISVARELFRLVDLVALDHKLHLRIIDYYYWFVRLSAKFLLGCEAELDRLEEVVLKGVLMFKFSIRYSTST